MVSPISLLLIRAQNGSNVFLAKCGHDSNPASPEHACTKNVVQRNRPKRSRFDSPASWLSIAGSTRAQSYLLLKLSCSLEHLILCVAHLSAWSMPLHAQPQLFRARASLKRHQAHLSFWFWVWREGTKPRTQSSFIQKGNG